MCASVPIANPDSSLPEVHALSCSLSQRLPGELGFLPDLEQIFAENNWLSTLPKELAMCRSANHDTPNSLLGLVRAVYNCCAVFGVYKRVPHLFTALINLS